MYETLQFMENEAQTTCNLWWTKSVFFIILFVVIESWIYPLTIMNKEKKKKKDFTEEKFK